MKLSVGPGALVVAGFIGPGTVTACTVAGANFGGILVEREKILSIPPLPNPKNVQKEGD